MSQWLCGAWLACLICVTTAEADSLDLSNAKSRWVAVAFEVSPPDRPEQLRTRYTRPLLARVEPGPRSGEIQVRIAADLVERFILNGHSPAPGSFDDFVWVFDASTGHVRSAELRGIVRREVGWGFASWTADTRIEVAMTTHETVAFKTDELAGQKIHQICAEPTAPDCTQMAPSALDPHTGYVNAVGSIHADSGPVKIESFSPLGEAIFSEIDPAGHVLSSATLEAPTRPDAGPPAPGD